MVSSSMYIINILNLTAVSLTEENKQHISILETDYSSKSMHKGANSVSNESPSYFSYLGKNLN